MASKLKYEGKQKQQQQQKSTPNSPISLCNKKITFFQIQKRNTSLDTNLPYFYPWFTFYQTMLLSMEELVEEVAAIIVQTVSVTSQC